MKQMERGSIIELGSGSGLKIRPLLDEASGRLQFMEYMPVDICTSSLELSVRCLTASYPGLSVTPRAADFNSSEFCRRLEMAASGRDKLILFLGGTIGNMDETESAVFLENIGQVMTSRDRFLIGMDMIKPKEVLEAAYNDSQGITAEFNRNILCALNSKFNAGFDVSCFEHQAFYDEEKERVEMHLRAKRDMCTPLKGLDVFLSMKKGETIRTEICRKFTREKIEDMAARAGLRTTRHFTDDRGWFALVEMIKDVQ